MNVRPLPPLPTDKEMRERRDQLLEEVEEQQVVMGGVSDCGVDYIDKKGWGPGPWQDEPDKLEFVDKDTGYPCLIRRNTHFGCLIGYVAVPKGYLNTLVYLSDGSELPLDNLPPYRVHGGVLYCGRSVSEPRINSEPMVNGAFIPLTHSLVDKETYWLGFDAAHADDFCPADHRPSIYLGESYKDIEYMKNQCRSLARQIANSLDNPIGVRNDT